MVNGGGEASAATYEVTPGVKHTQNTFSYNARGQISNILDIDTTSPYISVDIGIPNPLTSLDTVRTQASRLTQNNHHMVGAVNASFFHFNTALPAYLVAKDNRVSTFGVISTGMHEYMSIPSAFGVDSSGKPLISTFSYDSSIEFNGKKLNVSSVNKTRQTNETIIYTPAWRFDGTRQNTYGVEVVVRGLSKQLENGSMLGETISGKVDSVRLPGAGNAPLPSDGYVISVHGTDVSQYTSLKKGDTINLTMNVEDKWKNSEYILGSGPLLVQNGKVNMTIDPASSRATQRAARTAVILDSTRTKVKLVTVDATTASAGMTLNEFAQYLVSIGAYQALNLDGGGSTTMVARPYGYAYPQMINATSNGEMRSVSAILGAVSKAPYMEPAYLSANSEAGGKIPVGSRSLMTVNYISDINRHNLTFKQEDIDYSVEGNIGSMDGRYFIATAPGKGAIVAKKGNAIHRIPMEVTDTLKAISLSNSTKYLSPENTVQLSVQGTDANGRAISVDSSSISWKVSGNGSISANGIYKAGSTPGKATVTATVRGLSSSATIDVISGTIKLDSLESAGMWSVSTARADASISFPGSSRSVPSREGASSLRLNYDFSAGETGTTAAYVNATNPVTIAGTPDYIGLWVYGDGNGHWLRGKITDASGESLTINFTEEGMLNWNGWKYVKASVPGTAIGPIKVNQIYVAEPKAEKQGTGTIYLDDLKAEFGKDHAEPIFKDVANNYWGREEIGFLTERELITGYLDGTFKPEATLTRAHAAVLLSRVMDLSTDNVKDPGFQDVSESHTYYKEIAAVANLGIITGRDNGTRYDPQDPLTRAQMAAILTRAYNLTGMYSEPIADAPASFWAHKEINALAASGITNLYDGNYYKPNNHVKRSQFSAFLYRIINR